MRKLVLLVVLGVVAAALPPAGLAGAALEPKCSRSEVRDLVRDFVDAYNRGDVDRLEQMWAQEPDFFWYFVQDDASRRGALSERRETLILYFVERSMYADHLRLRDLSIRWERGWHGAWDIAFKVTRTSDDPNAAGRYHGKGMATCQRLHAWAMGRDG